MVVLIGARNALNGRTARRVGDLFQAGARSALSIA
jgi:hypothetical protein